MAAPRQLPAVLLPFLAAAFFLGTVFLKAQQDFRPRLFRRPHRLRASPGSWCSARCTSSRRRNCIIVPLVLWSPAACCGSSAWQPRGHRLALRRRRCASLAVHLVLPPRAGHPQLAVSRLQGHRLCPEIPRRRAHLPERLALRRPPGLFLLLHAFRARALRQRRLQPAGLPANTYLGMYIDGEGPRGSCATCRDEETAYFRYLPMIYPYLIKEEPDTFVVQFGGGISTEVALRSGSRTSPSPRATRPCSAPSTTRCSANSPATSSTTRAHGHPL